MATADQTQKAVNVTAQALGIQFSPDDREKAEEILKPVGNGTIITYIKKVTEAEKQNNGQHLDLAQIHSIGKASAEANVSENISYLTHPKSHPFSILYRALKTRSTAEGTSKPVVAATAAATQSPPPASPNPAAITPPAPAAPVSQSSPATPMAAAQPLATNQKTNGSKPLKIVVMPAVVPPDPQKTAFEFDTDKWQLSKEQKADIAKLAGQWKKGFKDTSILIEAHTDTVGSIDHNNILARQRALATRDELVRDGVSINRIYAVGFSKNDPQHLVEKTDDNVANAHNRSSQVSFISEQRAKEYAQTMEHTASAHMYGASEKLSLPSVAHAAPRDRLKTMSSHVPVPKKEPDSVTAHGVTGAARTKPPALGVLVT